MGDEGSFSARSDASRRRDMARNGSVRTPLLPDPNVVGHVHVDEHLAAMAELKATKRRCGDLETEVVQLRMQLDELGAAMRRNDADSSQYIQKTKELELERDRIAQEFAEA